MSVGGIGGSGRVQADLDLHATAAPAPTALAAPTGGAHLGLGSKGPEVKALQQKLIAAGIPVSGGADGIYGRGTATAVAAFQKSAKLPTTGEADAATLAALDKKLGAHPATGGAVSGIKLDPKDGYGPKTLTATVGGKTVKLADDALLAKTFADGRYVAWSSPKGAGGFENEGQAVCIFDAKTGKTTQVMSEYFMVEDLRYAKLPDGKEALLAPMMDGGLGMDRLAVIDIARGGECAMIDGAKLKSVSGSKVTVDQYKLTPDGDLKNTGKKTLDLAKLLKQPIIHNKREDIG